MMSFLDDMWMIIDQRASWRGNDSSTVSQSIEVLSKSQNTIGHFPPRSDSDVPSVGTHDNSIGTDFLVLALDCPSGKGLDQRKFLRSISGLFETHDMEEPVSWAHRIVSNRAIHSPTRTACSALCFQSFSEEPSQPLLTHHNTKSIQQFSKIGSDNETVADLNTLVAQSTWRA
jgi:hypothetical protein